MPRKQIAVPMLDEHRNANRANWDARVPAHLASAFYGVEDFVAGARTLTQAVDFDRALLGEVRGRSLLHLQCHIGLDTLSWAQAGRHRHRRRLLRALDRGGARHQPPQRRSGSLRARRCVRGARGARRDLRLRLCQRGRALLAAVGGGLGARGATVHASRRDPVHPRRTSPRARARRRAFRRAAGDHGAVLRGRRHPLRRAGHLHRDGVDINTPRPTSGTTAWARS